jgi:transcriptional regulator with XRE-family HTH domain
MPAGLPDRGLYDPDMARDPGKAEPALGPRIRAERQAAGVSLRELARRLGVSAGLLSMIERGRAQPSVATLWAIVRELGISLDALFAASPASDGATLVQRAGAREAIELQGGVRWERLSPAPDPDADFAFVTYACGADAVADAPAATHGGKEYGYVVSGRLEVEVGADTVELGPGDSIVFASETPHRFRALGDEPARAVWMNLARAG